MKLRVLFFLVAILPLCAEQLPKATSESLAGQKVLLPDALKGHPAVVVVGFSKNSQEPNKAWAIKAEKQLGDGFVVYSVAILQDAPSFIRGMIKHSMKGGTPADHQSKVLVVVEGEADWKKAAMYSTDAADDAYVLLVDGTGEIRWRTHGTTAGEAAVKELVGQAAGLK